MRLKYFLRGVGIGIIVTTIILTITHASDRKMSDSEVIDRAIELGMSFSASHSEQQGETEESSPNESSTEQETSGDEVTDGPQYESESESETEMETESQSTSETVTESTDGGEVLPEKESEIITETATQEITEIAAESTIELITCTISITKGMSSRTVCDMLKQNGIIDDAADFDRYLIKTGYDDKIRVGEVEVNSGMTYEELTAALYKK